MLTGIVPAKPNHIATDASIYFLHLFKLIFSFLMEVRIPKSIGRCIQGNVKKKKKFFPWFLTNHIPLQPDITCPISAACCWISTFLWWPRRAWYEFLWLWITSTTSFNPKRRTHSKTKRVRDKEKQRKETNFFEMSGNTERIQPNSLLSSVWLTSLVKCRCSQISGHLWQKKQNADSPTEPCVAARRGSAACREPEGFVLSLAHAVEPHDEE